MPKPPKPGYQRYRLLLAYDGTDYYGWQRLGHVSPTIQAVIEDRLSTIFNEKIVVVGSGRTDAGVHAQGQQAHFDAKPDPRRSQQLFNAISRITPPSIIVRGIWEAPPSFHAIWSVERKTYLYRVEASQPPGLYSYRYSHWVPRKLNLNLLQAHSNILLGKHDFKSFMTSGSDVKTTTREIYEAKWTEVKPNRFVFKVTGSGFLKHMVRSLAGTLLDLNKLNAPIEKMRDILESKDRQRALITAPARGLTLHRVFYPRELDIQCRKI